MMRTGVSLTVISFSNQATPIACAC
jgi:hypothetical protein